MEMYIQLWKSFSKFAGSNHISGYDWASYVIAIGLLLILVRRVPDPQAGDAAKKPNFIFHYQRVAVPIL